MKQTTTGFPGVCRVRIAFSVLLILEALFPGNELFTQTAQLHYTARGTGRTTGHVITLLVHNPTAQALRTTVGPSFVPSEQGYQGYVILKKYPVTVNPFSTAQLELEGYCTNVDRPAVSGGETMTEVAQWVTWVQGESFPDPGVLPPAGFTQVPEASAADPLRLTYPGTQIPLPYTIDFNQHPRAAARLLLHTAAALEQAYDGFVRDQLLQPATAVQFRQELVQQAFWAYCARLEGHRYDKQEFEDQFNEAVEQQLNLRKADFSPETKSQVGQHTANLWSEIALLGVSAKIIPVTNALSDPVFEETPAGPAGNAFEMLPQILENINPVREDADRTLVPVLLFFQKNKVPLGQETLRQAAKSLWENFLRRSVNRINPDDPDALSGILILSGLLNCPAARGMSRTARAELQESLLARLERHLKLQIKALDPGEPDFLKKWRYLDACKSTAWYNHLCAKSKPLNHLPRPGKLRSGNVLFRSKQIPLAGPQWKHRYFPDVPPAEPRKFPWWIPAVAVPVGGGAVYAVLNNTGSDNPPAPPVAASDALNLSCFAQGTIDVLANDSGEGITVSTVTAPLGVMASVAGASSVQISSSTAGTFVLNYVLTDRAGQNAVGMITLTVGDMNAPVMTCPPGITLEGCNESPTPAQAGQATVSDDCDPAPKLIFIDEPGGVPCLRTYVRTWIGTDASGKSSTCEQLITVQDRTPPMVGQCPPSIAVSFGAHLNTALTGLPVASDNCPTDLTMTFSDNNSGLADCTGPVVRTWRIVDGCTNTATCAQTIQVTDNTAPVFSFCPPAISVECGQENDLTITGMATATDNCTGSMTPVFSDDMSGFNGCTGQILRIWTAIDGAWNSASCTQTIEVADQTAPVFTLCPPPVSVFCGQENNLNFTGVAVAEDACASLPSVSFSDDLSQFDQCKGLVFRTWMAVDQCGNATPCEQTISVEAAPCSFTVNFLFAPATCGNCTGYLEAEVLPPGFYNFSWSDGKTGPVQTGLCAGTYTVSIHDPVNSCTEVFTQDLPDQSTLDLLLVEYKLPSTPSGNDGSITVQTQPFTAPLPLELFVNGEFAGETNKHLFEITGLPAGVYEIQVVDANGCPSDTLVVELFPVPRPGAGFVQFPLAGNVVLPWGGLLHALENQILENTGLPEHPANGGIIWGNPYGIELHFSIGKNWQIHWLDSRRQGFVTQFVAGGHQLAVQLASQDVSLRNYRAFNTATTFFREGGLAHHRMRGKQDPVVPNAAVFTLDAWQIYLGGGFQIPVLQQFNLEWTGRLYVGSFDKKMWVQPVCQVRLAGLRKQ